MKRRLQTILWLWCVGSAACGRDDEDGHEPGTELGPCVQGRFCESPLSCADGLCVNPDQLADTGADEATASGALTLLTSAGEGSASASVGESGLDSVTGVTGADGGGDEVHCTSGDPNGCLCSHSADYGPPGVACSTSTLGGTAQCCAGEGWPSYGSCSCWALSCRVLSSDTCYCGIGLTDPEDQQVESCSAGEGVCCRDAAGGDCSCYSGLSACLEGDEVVSSCSVADLHCGGNQMVAACN